MEFETVIGLEIHVELATVSKMFCGCSTAFGQEPNTACCPVCLGHPGALPTLNKKAVGYAVMAALSLGCELTKVNRFDRKNYFYPDLPKAYQISQLYLPLGRNGHITINADGKEKIIGIHELHMEEDAGKLIHEGDRTFIDCNRCGVPLIEIVTEPDFGNSKEVTAFLLKLKSMFEYMKISDCKMQEGSLRVDVNLSVRHPGEPLGVRTEMKNLNSFRAVERAVAFESARQKEVISSGGKIIQETRRWDDKANVSVAMRSKENADDYRYFPEPDIPPILIDESVLKEYNIDNFEFADKKAERFCREHGITAGDADIITASPYTAELYEQTVAKGVPPGEVRYWMMNGVLYLLNEKGLPPDSITLKPQKLAEFCKVVLSGAINRQTAKTVFCEMFFSKDNFDIEKYIKDNELSQVSDISLIKETVAAVISENPKPVAQYKAGQDKVVGFFVGQVMKHTGGRAAPETVKKTVIEELLKL